MKFLIVGFGSIGRRHFNNLLALGEKDILFYRTGQSTLDSAELNDYPVFTDLEQALAMNPDGVIIANPTAFHLEAAIPAARQGCHILLEKPISHNRDRVEEFSREVEKSGSRVLVGYQFRYHPNLIQIKTLLEEGVIGSVLAVRSHWGEYLPNWHPWEDYRNSYSARKELGGGVLLTLCHSFDYLGWLFGDGQVQDSLLGYRGGLGIEVEDTAEVLLTFSDQIIATIHLNYLQLPPQHSLEIIGAAGTIYWDYFQNRVDITVRSQTGEVQKDSHFCPDEFERNDLFLQEMRHFIEVITNKVSPICTLEDGRKALDLLIEAGRRGI